MDYGFYNPCGSFGPLQNFPQWQGMSGYVPAGKTPAQLQQSGPDWIMAPSIKQVEQVGVQPGQKAWIMVQNEPVFALRTADQMGLVTTDYYRFEKIDPNTAGAAPNADYITRQELDSRLKELLESLNAGKKEGAK